ncbi:hypothetical protein [Dongia deserti]|uniref:hypothetical protein n=1 Tax=Dongia deserti TaxID=2268030 RepID=UPI0013C43738|nr:hypothetical protein [Dongia deserti]
MFAGLKKAISAVAVAGLVLGASLAAVQAAESSQPDDRIVVGAAAAKVIGEYLSKVSGRYGALAVSRDGQSAAYYICQSRLWKNCDDYYLEDEFKSVPSGRLAARQAEQRCRGYASGGCVVLFINDQWIQEFTLAQ